MKRQKPRRRRFLGLTRKRLVIATIFVVGVFVLGNAALWATYHNRTYPRSKIMGVPVGSISYARLAQATDKLHLPDKLDVVYGSQRVTTTLADLGISKDPARTIQSANRQRSWLPMLNLLKSPMLPTPVRVNQAAFAKKAQELAKVLRKDAVNAHLTLSGTTVGIAEGRAGYELGTQKLETAVLASLDKGKVTVAAPVQTTTPKIQAAALQPEQEKLKGQLATAVTLRYGDKSTRASAADVASWFAPHAEIYTLAPDKVQAYITGVGKTFGIRVKDLASVVSSTVEAVTNRKTLDVTLVRQLAAKTYTYCVATRGVDASFLPTFRSKLQGTLNDSRSWSLDGLVEFKEVTSGCNFTAWLSAADQVPEFGGVCDAQWSCRSGANVVVNFDRWQNASPAWNAAHGALDEYRNMVINHETGHWLGFGHAHCSGAGQPAPVMQQQSIDLEGCAFNAWPAGGELASLRRTLGL